MTAERSNAWGGARAGAGRPARGPRPSERHRKRPPLAARHPVHVTAHVVTAVGSLRRGPARRALDRALVTSLARRDFRIVELAVRAARLDLIVEADDKLALARGMQGFTVAAARYLNRVASRRGTVFPDRYRARILRSRAAVRTVRAAIGSGRGSRALVAPKSVARPETRLLLTLDRPRPRARR